MDNTNFVILIGQLDIHAQGTSNERGECCDWVKGNLFKKGYCRSYNAGAGYQQSEPSYWNAVKIQIYDSFINSTNLISSFVQETF